MRARVSVVWRGGGVAWCVCVPARGRVVSRCRTTRTKVLVLCARVVSVGPSSCCVPNMHAKDERPDVLVDAGGLLRSVPGDPCVAADSCHKLCKFAPRCLFFKKKFERGPCSLLKPPLLLAQRPSSSELGQACRMRFDHGVVGARSAALLIPITVYTVSTRSMPSTGFT